MSSSAEGRILVTGALGQIGTDLVKSLREIYGSAKVIASDIRSLPENPSILGGPFSILDVLDEEKLSKLVIDEDIKIIYHLAAILSAKGEENPELCELINVDGTRNILEVARRNEIRVFIPSSIAVFGPDAPKHAPQLTPLNPSTKYGMTKVDCEIMGMLYCEQYGVDVRGIRYPGLISWQSPVSGGTTDYAVDIFHFALSNEQSYECFVRRDTKLPMMYMDDAIRATISLMNQPLESLSSARCGYNISGISFTAEELSSQIKNHIPNFICTYKPDVRQIYADSWPDSIDDTIAKKDWNWSPNFQLVDIVEDMIKNLKE
jgi:nucleoside-diphosphate-sugar epimerase|tara:strand:+ start:130 stop:1086 length:957 start_codon:yes stop_codon:yes gene_type:complete